MRLIDDHHQILDHITGQLTGPELARLVIRTDTAACTHQFLKLLTDRGHGEETQVPIDLVTYVVINAFLIGVWAVTGFGYFWPGWVMAFWAVLLGLDAWGLFSRRPITDNDIEQEMRHLK